MKPQSENFRLSQLPVRHQKNISANFICKEIVIFCKYSFKFQAARTLREEFKVEKKVWKNIQKGVDFPNFFGNVPKKCFSRMESTASSVKNKSRHIRFVLKKDFEFDFGQVRNPFVLKTTKAATF